MDFQHTTRVFKRECRKCGAEFYTRVRNQKYCAEHSTHRAMGRGEVLTADDYKPHLRYGKEDQT